MKSIKKIGSRLDLVTYAACYGLVTLIAALVWIPGIYLTIDNRSSN